MKSYVVALTEQEASLYYTATNWHLATIDDYDKYSLEPLIDEDYMLTEEAHDLLFKNHARGDINITDTQRDQLCDMLDAFRYRYKLDSKIAFYVDK
jgi:hypothetical protein